MRWERASGVVEHFFDDECVPGSHGVRHDLLAKIEPFPISELVDYDTAYLSGFVVEPYQVLVNGYSGKTAGDYPLSPWKILILIVVVLIVAVIVIVLSQE